MSLTTNNNGLTLHTGNVSCEGRDPSSYAASYGRGSRAFNNLIEDMGRIRLVLSNHAGSRPLTTAQLRKASRLKDRTGAGFVTAFLTLQAWEHIGSDQADDRQRQRWSLTDFGATKV